MDYARLACQRVAEQRLKTWGVTVLRELWGDVYREWEMSVSRGSLALDPNSLCNLYLDRLSVAMDPDRIITIV